MTESFLTVEPMYGNGWFANSTGPSRSVPIPFQVAVTSEDDALRGVVVTALHEFEGASVAMTQRFSGLFDIFNISVKRGGSTIAVGYARVPERS